MVLPNETWKGLSELGFNWFVCLLGTVVLHLALSYPTQKSWLLNPTFPIYIDRISQARHGSDSQLFDSRGQINEANLNEVVARYGSPYRNGLSFTQLLSMVRAHRNVGDLYGQMATMLEWSIAWLMVSDSNGLMHKEDIRACLDGSLFYRMAKHHQRRRGRIARKPTGMWMRSAFRKLGITMQSLRELPFGAGLLGAQARDLSSHRMSLAATSSSAYRGGDNSGRNLAGARSGTSASKSENQAGNRGQSSNSSQSSAMTQSLQKARDFMHSVDNSLKAQAPLPFESQGTKQIEELKVPDIKSASPIY